MKTYILVCFMLVADFQFCTSQEHGSCVFPCSWQGRVFGFPALNNDDIILDFSGSDPTSFSAKGTYTGYCYARSGPFFALRRQINGTTTYLCIKDTMFNREHDLMVYYRMSWVPFSGNPTICDICHGKGNWKVLVLKDLPVECGIVKIPDLDCNIPQVCPVTDPDHQIPCDSCTSSESKDEGLCCPDK